ncbi:hypothetical protein CDAR_537091, partial [Caerostris darwini]
SSKKNSKDAYSSTEKYWKQNKCPLCPYITGSNPHYIDHLMGHVTGPPIQCPVCRRCFASKHSVQEHLLFHTKRKPYQCLVCNQHFNLKGTRQRHMRIHSGENRFQCLECSKLFFRMEHLLTHYHTQHKWSAEYIDSL